METIKYQKEEKERFDKFLSEELDISRTLASKMIQEGCALLNGTVSKPANKMSFGDEVQIVKEYEEQVDLEPENILLDIVYEDNDVILINKPSGMVVHPGSGNFSHTMVNALLYYTNELSDCNGEVRPGIVHRIDKDTSGLILVAKNNRAHAILAEDFKHKKIKRKYIALVCGVLQHNHITIDAPIGRDKVYRKQMAVTAENSKSAVTHVHVLKRFKDYTLVECELETGRTHQIRVHLAYIGYPIYNDPVYNKKEATTFGQFLHSSEITFETPGTHETLHFTCPLPKEFQDFLKELEKEETAK